MSTSIRFSQEAIHSPSVSPTPRRLSVVASSEDDAVSSDDKSDRLSLSLNYLPAKFSSPHSPTPTRLRSRRGHNHLPGIKQGGGRNVFKENEARMPSVNEHEDEDEDSNLSQPRKGLPALRWTPFKCVLFFSNAIFSAYSLIGLIFCLLTWFNVWANADVIRVANRPELILSTFAAAVAVITSMLGLLGLFLNNRPFLAAYSFLCWITFATLVVPGYITYKRRTFDLQGKLNLQWSRELDLSARLRIQNELDCCGYFNPFVEAAVSQWCYSRSQFPGCAAPFLQFERNALEIWYTTVFSIVPVQIGIMIVGLLCSNHVTYRFGKGMMPKPYRISLISMAIMMEKYASEFAQQYHPDSRATTPVVVSNSSKLQIPFIIPVIEVGQDSQAKSSSGPSQVHDPNYHCQGREGNENLDGI